MSIFKRFSRRSHTILGSAFDQDRDDRINNARSDGEPVVERLIELLIAEANNKYAARQGLIDCSRFDIDISMPDERRDQQVLKHVLEGDIIDAIAIRFNRQPSTFSVGIAGFREDERELKFGDDSKLDLSVWIQFMPPLDPRVS